MRILILTLICYSIVKNSWAETTRLPPSSTDHNANSAATPDGQDLSSAQLSVLKNAFCSNPFKGPFWGIFYSCYHGRNDKPPRSASYAIVSAYNAEWRLVNYNNNTAHKEYLENANSFRKTFLGDYSTSELKERGRTKHNAYDQQVSCSVTEGSPPKVTLRMSGAGAAASVSCSLSPDSIGKQNCKSENIKVGTGINSKPLCK